VGVGGSTVDRLAWLQFIQADVGNELHESFLNDRLLLVMS
jgi:hypothetical protein